MREVFGRRCPAVVNDLRLRPLRVAMRPLLAGASVGLVAQPPAADRNARPTDEIVVTESPAPKYRVEDNSTRWRGIDFRKSSS